MPFPTARYSKRSLHSQLPYAPPVGRLVSAGVVERAELPWPDPDRWPPVRAYLQELTSESEPDVGTAHLVRDPMHQGAAFSIEINDAIKPVQPVWWEAPSPFPVSPWKYSWNCR